MPSVSQRSATPVLEVQVPAELVEALDKFLANTHCSTASARSLGDEIAQVALRIGNSWQSGTTIRVAGEILKALVEPFNNAAQVKDWGVSLGDTRLKITELVNLAALTVINPNGGRLSRNASTGDFLGPNMKNS